MTTPRPHGIDAEQVLAHDPFVRGLARQLLRDRHAADDVVQQTWTAACQQPEPPTSLRAWLVAVVRRLAGRRVRTERRELLRQQAAARPELMPSTATIVQREAVRTEVVRAVLALAEPYRQVVLLRWFENLPPRVIARRLRLPVETVRTRLKRALAELRLRLDAHAGGDRASWCALLIPFAREAGFAAAAAATIGPLVPGVLLMSIPARLATIGVLLASVLAAAWWFGTGAPAAPNLPPTATPTAPAPATADAPAGSGTVAPAPATGEDERQPVAPPSAPATGSLLVHAVWGDGTKAAHVPVEVRRLGVDDRLALPQGITDAAGEVRFEELAPGRVYAQAWRAQMSAGRRTEITAGTETSVTLSLSKGIDATGIVVDDRDRPVAGAEILVADWGGSEARTLGRSAEDGTFSLRAIGTHCHVGARAAGFRATSMRTITASEGAVVGGLRLVLAEPAAVVAGTVLGPDGEPVALALVRIGSDQQNNHKLPDGGAAMAPRPALLRTDAQGRFVADSLPAGKLPIAVLAARLARFRDEVEAVAGARCDLTVHLQEGVTLNGTVRNDKNEPVAKADVRVGDWRDLGGQWKEADANGTFHFEGLPVGELPVVVNHDELGKAETRLNGAPGEKLTWNPVLSSGLTLSGRVVDDQDQPVANVILEARAEGGTGTWYGDDSTGADGRFTFKNCKSDTPIRIDARRHMMVEARVRGARPGGDEIVIRLPKAEFARIRGTVLGPDDKPLGNVDLSVRQPGSGGDMDPVSATGAFDAGPYPPGELIVKLSSPGFGPILRRRIVAPNEVWDLGTLRFEPGGTLALALVGTGATPPKVQRINVFDRDDQWIDNIEAKDGRARAGPYVPGDYTAQILGENFGAVRLAFSIRKDTETKLDVPLPAGVPVELTFAMPADADPDSLEVELRAADGTVALRSSAWRRRGPAVLEAVLAVGRYRVAVTERKWCGDGAIEVAGAGPVRATIAVTPR